MIRFKSHSVRDGFSLLEVTFALAIIAALLSTLLTMQTNGFYSLSMASSRLRKMYMLKNALYEQARNAKITAQTKISEKQATAAAPVKISSATKVPGKKSALADFVGISLRTITAEWQTIAQKTERETLAKLVYKKPEKKKP